MKLPKIKIDYSKAGTGEAPFDGKECLLFYGNGRVENGILHGGNLSQKTIQDILLNPYLPTRYTPMPEFEEVQESNQQVKKDLVVTGETKWFKKWPVKGGE